MGTVGRLFDCLYISTVTAALKLSFRKPDAKTLSINFLTRPVSILAAVLLLLDFVVLWPQEDCATLAAVFNEPSGGYMPLVDGNRCRARVRVWTHDSAIRLGLATPTLMVATWLSATPYPGEWRGYCSRYLCSISNLSSVFLVWGLVFLVDILLSMNSRGLPKESSREKADIWAVFALMLLYWVVIGCVMLFKKLCSKPRGPEFQQVLSLPHLPAAPSERLRVARIFLRVLIAVWSTFYFAKNRCNTHMGVGAITWAQLSEWLSSILLANMLLLSMFIAHINVYNDYELSETSSSIAEEEDLVEDLV